MVDKYKSTKIPSQNDSLFGCKPQDGATKSKTKASNCHIQHQDDAFQLDFPNL
jgi:hypothetical protein